jgi:hypothetical protein
MNRYEKFVATFEPVRRDDLRDNAADWIGRRLTWQRMWLIEDGPYAGQWACSPYDGKTFEPTPFSWVPECDLSNAVTTVSARSTSGDVHGS